MSSSTQDTSVSIHIDDGAETTQLKPQKKSHKHGDDHHDHSNCNHDHGGGHGGHSHGHGGHSHGGRNKWLMGHGLEIKLFVYGIIASVWAITFFWLVEPLGEAGFDRFGSRVAITFFAAMAQISYYRCTTLKNGNPTKNIPAHAAPDNAKQCKNCNFWKPERTHHCSTCNECILRMDHHCPWICNCVGYKNHKAFILFCSYCAIGTLYFDYRTIYFIIAKFSDETFFDLSIPFLIFWFLITIIACPGGLMVGGLSLYHISLAMNNLTTLEAMGGANMKTPCDSQTTREKKFTNKWDAGFLSNLFNFFGNSYLFWWFPTSPATAYEAQHFDQLPNPSPTEILEFLRGANAEESPEEKIMKPKSLAEVDLENIFKIAEEFTKDKHLQFYNVMLEIGKRRDQTYKPPSEVASPVKQQQQQIQEEVEIPAAKQAEPEVQQQESEHNQQEEEPQQVVENVQEQEAEAEAEIENVEVENNEEKNNEPEAVIVNSEGENIDQESDKKADEAEQGEVEGESI